MKVWPFVAAAILVAFLVRRRRSLEPTLLAGGGIVAAALCVYGTGVIKFPDLEQLLLDIGDTLGNWTYLLVAGLAFLETGAFVGLIAPGETAMILGGVVAGQGQISIITLIAITWAAAVAGDCTSYYLGKRLGRPFLVKHGPRFQITEERLVKVEAFFDKHGGKAIFVGRFVGLVRAIAPFLAGSGRMPFRRFIPYDVLGAGLWASTFLLLGYVFWHSLGTVLDVAKKGALGLGVAITLVAGIIWAVRWIRVPENRREAERWIGEQLERPYLRPLAPVVRWARGPARFLWHRITPGELGLEFTTLLAVAAVGSFAYIGSWIQIKENTYSGADPRVHGWAVDLASGTGTDVAKALTVFGAPSLIWPVAAFAFVLLLLHRLFVEAAILGGGLVLTVVCVQVAKHSLERARPADALIDASGWSFPSAHAAYAVTWIVLAMIAVRVVPALRGRWWLVVAAGVLTIVVGLTRLYLRVHWFSDVLAGAGAAAMSFALVAILALLVAFLRQNPRTA